MDNRQLRNYLVLAVATVVGIVLLYRAFSHIRTVSGIHSRFYTVWRILAGEGELLGMTSNKKKL